MSQPDPRNPEHKSSNAMLCFCIGLALAGAAYFMGVGGIIVAAFSGGDPLLVAGGVGMLIGLPLAAISGCILMAIGGVWMLSRVVADQTGSAEERRYRDIER
ncbi:hypothetical protein [Terricaulis sp.]|uniref:hypothetical protein n=1 Tax=Terricaulis sp. TaxID=2768686 RepID=UPI003784690B